MNDFTNLYATLSYLVGPAGVAAWMLFVSDLVRNWVTEGKLTKFSALGKASLTAGLSFGLPGLAYAAILLIPKETFDTIQPHYGFIASMFLAYLVQQGYFYVKNKAAGPKVAGPQG